MTQIPLRTEICKTLQALFQVDSGHSLYMIISKPFSTGSNYTESRAMELDVWKNAIAAKRILDLDVYLMASKNTWVYGATYSQYTDDLAYNGDTPQYVSTTNGNVYKCLDNNGGDAAQKTSTTSPYGADTEDIRTPDGYVWKYIMTVTDDLFDFTTDDLIPIRTLAVDPKNTNKYPDARALQYDVQFNAVDGAVHTVFLTGTNTALFPATIANGKIARLDVDADATTIHVRNDDLVGNPIGYSLVMTSGNGSGLHRTITGYTSTESSKTYVIDSAFGVPMSVNDQFKVLPKTELIGDGSGAVLIPIMNNVTKAITRVLVNDRGSGYKYATARIVPPNETTGVDGTVGAAIVGTIPSLDPQIPPVGGHGSDPVMELRPDKIMVTAFLDREEDKFPSENDYSQFSLVLDPKIGGTGPNAGRIAGSEIQRFSLATIRTKPGDYTNGLGYEVGDLLLGKDSHSAGAIVDIRSLSDTVAYIDLSDVSGAYKESEEVVGITMGSSGVFSSSGKKASVIQFQEDRYLGTNTNNYRLTTTLGVHRPTGIAAADILLDATIVGASGSTGIAVYSDTTSAGTTANIYVTGITGGTWGTEYGYTFGEYITIGGGITASINTITTPGLQAGTGRILHGHTLENSITRHCEQSELIRLLIDFGV